MGLKNFKQYRIERRDIISTLEYLRGVKTLENVFKALKPSKLKPISKRPLINLFEETTRPNCH